MIYVKAPIIHFLPREGGGDTGSLDQSQQVEYEEMMLLDEKEDEMKEFD